MEDTQAVVAEAADITDPVTTLIDEQTPPVSAEEAPKCKKCGVDRDTHSTITEGPMKKMDWGGKRFKAAAIMITCTECGQVHDFVGLNRGNVAQRPGRKTEQVKKHRRQMARASRKANAHQRKGNGKGK